ncbi:hypothetical protein M501DRAFT_943938 [Patellaria atrata CBS 101060]|uniref:Nuclear pore complex protein An-Nup82 n=1 Tax=Patellaria atrata CBS 101060 TaxID=1346257 RepID=A0A9P4VNJ5_9PEZI|nr:hypothetical protein M501DRAFT_943938 [Patellaria atrata CBS 101060]
MPKVLAYTPDWLSRPTPGFKAFASKGKIPSQQFRGPQSSNQYRGAHRIIARRGTEVFVVVDNEIRWTDLVLLKEVKESEDDPEAFYKVLRPLKTKTSILKSPTSGQITQLVISPGEDYLAILTPNTIHLAILPHSSLLTSDITGPLKLKTFHLGPTTHVVEESSLVSVLWHPLGNMSETASRALVTITEDATLRLWEVNRDDRFSFSNPTLAVDLKKLSNATSAEDDVSASSYGTSNGFSADHVDMEVASACFGGTGKRYEENPWAAMTLWINMTGGDVYALCPLLPSRWQWSSQYWTSQHLHSLVLDIASKEFASSDDRETQESDQLIYEQQISWLEDIEDQEPVFVEMPGFEEVQYFSRPSSVNAIPRLQGPFPMKPLLSDDYDYEFTDIYVTGLGSDNPGEEHGPADRDVNQANIVSLLTNSGELQVFLNLEGVEAQWLPTSSRYIISRLSPSLILFETVRFRSDLESLEESHPTFTPDVHSPASFFITDEAGVFWVSVGSWAEALRVELDAPQEGDIKSRFRSVYERCQTIFERPIQLTREQLRPNPHSSGIATCVALKDSDIGYFVLTVVNSQPYAAVLEGSYDELLLEEGNNYEPELNFAPPIQPRPIYQPPQTFWEPSDLPLFLESRVHRNHRRYLKEEVKLSEVTLGYFGEVHGIVSRESEALGHAASDLFRRCERLQDELRAQIQKSRELAARIDGITGDNEEFSNSEERVVGNEKIKSRLEAATKNQANLSSRYERFKEKLARVGGKELSEKEIAWGEELDEMSRKFGVSLDNRNGTQEQEKTVLGQRFREVEQLKEELKRQMRVSEEVSEGVSENGDVQIPSELRRTRVAHVMELLDRQNAMVEGTLGRLNRLSLSS